MLLRALGALGITAVLGVGGLILASASGTFDGSPPTPLGYQQGTFLDGWSVNVHERSMASVAGGQGLGDAIHPLAAQHGADCASPPATHNTGNSRSAAVFQCRDHMMTALNGDEYGVIYLMPPELADFTNGPAIIQWDMSTEKMSVRDWWDVTISPLMDAQSLPLLSALSQGVDLQGPNRNAVFVGSDNGEGAANIQIVRNGSITDYGPPGWAGVRPSDGVVAGTNQAATRQTFRITLTTTSLRMERLASPTAPGLVLLDQAFPALSWTQGVVQWGHHSYTPDKDNAGVPATWHWDNFSITPYVPFYLKHHSVYFGDGGGVLNIEPAPAGAYLRFSAVCTTSVNGVIVSPMLMTNPIGAASYLVPLPVGTSQVSIGLNGSHCNAKDFDVVAMNGGTPSPPTQTATPGTGTPTPTVLPSPSATSTPSVTQTPSASPTPLPTPTPDSRRYRCQVRQGFSWVTVWDGAFAGRTCP